MTTVTSGGDGGRTASSGNGEATAAAAHRPPLIDYPPYPHEHSLSQRMRTYRHNPCLMRPVAALMVLVMCILALLGLIFQLPTFALGLITAPLLRRGALLVEFLYPLGIARWGHLVLMRWGLKSRVGGGAGGAAAAPGTDENGRPRKVPPPQHSRSIEQRIEVVRGRVYVHPLPQLLDNVGYLIVCLPPPRPITTANVCGDGDDDDNDDDPVLGILVDVGDAASALAQCEVVYDTHYAPALLRSSRGDLMSSSKKKRKKKRGGKKDSSSRRFEIRSVLCTHKHHDHTAGNRSLLCDKHELTREAKNLGGVAIYGGAVERVPYCNRPVRNGERIELPRAGRNVVADLVEIECIAVPSHTRGSVVYALRPKLTAASSEEGTNNFVMENTAHLFTGDAMFSGGGGVAFEADVDRPGDRLVGKKNADSPIRAASGRNSMERCFAEVLVRSAGVGINGQAADAVGTMRPPPLRHTTAMIYPGHEYTSELLVRQFDTSSEYHGQWNRVPPSVFFHTASHYLVSSHRRSLPKHGRILTVPTSLGREMVVNPHFRSLRKRGEHLVTAMGIWYRHCAKNRLQPSEPSSEPVPLTRNKLSRASSRGSGKGGSSSFRRSDSFKTPSTSVTWTMDHDDVSRPVFTTVYTSDLDSVASDLRSNMITPAEAARRLEAMAKRLDEPVVRRRPIPGTIPGDRNAYLGVLALLVLGSPPCGMTSGDARSMGLAGPTDTSDEVRISRRRLILALELLGLMDPTTKSGVDSSSPSVRDIIDLLWEEAADGGVGGVDQLRLEEEEAAAMNGGDNSKESKGGPDEIELGLVKHALYGPSMNRPSWFGRLCRPCGGGNASAVPSSSDSMGSDRASKAGGGGRGKASSSIRPRKSNGELVRHDASTCPMCVDAVGCPYDEDAEEKRWDGLLPEFDDELDESENDDDDEEEEEEGSSVEGGGVGGDGEGAGGGFEAPNAEVAYQRSSLMEGVGAVAGGDGDGDDEGGIELNFVANAPTF